MKHSAWLVAKVCLIKNVVNEDRNADVIMEQRFSLACFSLQGLLNGHVRSFKLSNCFHVLCCNVLWSNLKDGSHFFSYVRHEVGSFFRNECQWKVSVISQYINGDFSNPFGNLVRCGIGENFLGKHVHGCNCFLTATERR